MTERCDNCFFSVPITGNENGIVCRRYPPTVYNVEVTPQTTTISSYRPMLALDEWCGEWKAKDKALLINNRSIRNARKT